MSCATLSQSTVRMAVSMGALPEGFCPESMQELADAMATRLIVTPNQNFTSFAAGSVAPTSNVGPWFKDCETWFIWDDVTASYVPMTKQGFNNQQYFTTSQNFLVPAFIYKLRITAIGGGGGGRDAGGGSGGGGAGGGFGVKILSVNPSDSIALIIGQGGAHAAGTGAVGTDTTITAPSGLVMTAFGGTGGTVGNQSLGGVVTGSDYFFQGAAGDGASIHAGNGGDAGGWGGKGGKVGVLLPQRIGLVPGGGGCGGLTGLASDVGGSGGNGACLIEW